MQQKQKRIFSAALFGEVVTEFPTTRLLEKAKPILKKYPGWKSDIRGIRDYVKDKKVYPNDPCPCGSGKKYKKCCGKHTS